MKFLVAGLSVGLFAALLASVAGAQGSSTLPSVDDTHLVSVGMVADQMDYSTPHDMLFVLDAEYSGSIVNVVDFEAQAVMSSRAAVWEFTDLSVSPSGNYLFLADYFPADFSGEVIFGYPINPNYVHRYDIRAGTWQAFEVPKIAFRIEAVSDTDFVLLEQDQFVDITLNRFGASAITELASSDTSISYPENLFYRGDIAYNPASKLLYHGDSRSTSRKVSMIRVENDDLELVKQAGQLQSYSSTVGGDRQVTLSSDGLNLWYEDALLDPLTLAIVKHFPEPIAAATETVAWGVTGKPFVIDTLAALTEPPLVPSSVMVARGTNETFFGWSNQQVLHCETDGANFGCPRIYLCNGLRPDIVGTTGMPEGSTGAVITGTEGDDVIVGSPGNDSIDGLGGNDVICGLGGDDVINGGDGDDVILAGGGNDTVTGGSGKDRIRGQNGNDTIHGGPDNDNLNGNNGDDVVNGGGGNDYVSGRDGKDIVNGGPGNDVINGGGKSDVMRGGPGDDIMSGNGFADQIFGDDGNDVMSGGDGPDHLRGGPGDDALDGNRGNDTLWGGGGTDTCEGRTGYDTQASCESTVNIP